MSVGILVQPLDLGLEPCQVCPSRHVCINTYCEGLEAAASVAIPTKRCLPLMKPPGALSLGFVRTGWASQCALHSPPASPRQALPIWHSMGYQIGARQCRLSQRIIHWKIRLAGLWIELPSEVGAFKVWLRDILAAKTTTLEMLNEVCLPFQALWVSPYAWAVPQMQQTRPGKFVCREF